jgi:uncharacterized repeat protein (TIGR03803 family)
MTNLTRWAWMLMLSVSLALAASAQRVHVVARFNADANYVEASLLQTSDGSFYGTAILGGPYPLGGGVFRLAPNGDLFTLYNFCTQPNCTDGAEPYGGLIQASDGNFYGTTFAGGTGGCSDGEVPGCGTVFRLTPQGVLTTLYNFCSKSGCKDGGQPLATLVQAGNGKLYGTTAFEGGTVFAISLAGKLTTIHRFHGYDGAVPAARDALVESGRDGNLYGTTAVGGAHEGGTVFRITPRGKVTTLYDFCAQPECADGSHLISGLLQTAKGTLFGTTIDGGAHGGGTVFKITTHGRLITLHSFCFVRPNCLDGVSPKGRLIQAHGQLLGTTHSGGVYGGGTIYEITPWGKFTGPA